MTFSQEFLFLMSTTQALSHPKQYCSYTPVYIEYAVEECSYRNMTLQFVHTFIVLSLKHYIPFLDRSEVSEHEYSMVKVS